jgi:hypothetical protein
MVERRVANRLLVGNPKGKRPLGRSCRGWEGNIKIDLQEVGWRGMDWIDPSPKRDKWRAVVYMVMNIPVPQHAGYFLTG